MARRQHVRRDNFGHVVFVHLVRNRPGRRPRDRRRAPRRCAPEVSLGVPTDVDDLAEELRAVIVDRVGDAPEPRDAAGIVADHALRATDARRVHADRLEDDEADPTPGLLGVIVDVPLAREVVVPVVRGVGGDEDAVS